MQNPVASLPTPAAQGAFPAATGISVRTGGAESSAAVDFALLLLGQLGTPVGLPEESLPALTEAPAEEEIVDASLVLAAMGLSLTPPAPPKEGKSDGITTAGRIPLAEGKSLPPADGGDLLQGESRGLSAVTGRGMPVAAADSSASSATALVGETSAAVAAPAKFAGFEQALTEAVGNAPESAPQPIASHFPSPTSSRPVADAPTQVATPLRDPAWSTDFSQKLVWMATQDKQSAQLTLNPPQMGPIEISLSVKNDQATALFVSANAEVREAIESAMPRLREMLAGVGVELGQTNVSAESFRQAQDNNPSKQSGTNHGNGHGDDQQVTGELGGAVLTAAASRGVGLVDTFV